MLLLFTYVINTLFCITYNFIFYRMNPNDGTFKFDLHVDYSQWLIDFVANGTILGKPINENGHANVTIRK